MWLDHWSFISSASYLWYLAAVLLIYLNTGLGYRVFGMVNAPPCDVSRGPHGQNDLHESPVISWIWFRRCTRWQCRWIGWQFGWVRRQCRWIECHLRWTIRVYLHRFTQIRPISEGNLEEETDNIQWTGCPGSLKVPQFISWFAMRPNQRPGSIPTTALDLPTNISEIPT